MSQNTPFAPPGWYPEPGTGFVRWWDGAAWGPYQAPQQHPVPLAPPASFPAAPAPTAPFAAAEPHPFGRPVAPAEPPSGQVYQPYPGAAPQPLSAAPSLDAPQPVNGDWRYTVGPTVGYVPRPAPVATNGFAVAALILGIWGFLTTWIPFGIGLVIGGIPDILAIVFGIVALTRAPRLAGRGTAPAIVGLILGGLAFLSIFIGAGTVW
jgi:hypothetical protein